MTFHASAGLLRRLKNGNALRKDVQALAESDGGGPYFAQ